MITQSCLRRFLFDCKIRVDTQMPKYFSGEKIADRHAVKIVWIFLSHRQILSDLISVDGRGMSQKITGQLFSQRSLQTNALELSWNHCETGPESGKEISRDFPSPNSLWSEFSCIQTWDTNEVGRERNIGITRKTCDRARPAYRYYIQKETSPLFSLSLAHSESEDVCHTFFLPCISPESQPSCECPLLCGLAGWREGPLLTWDPSRSLYARGLNATRYFFMAYFS